MYIERNRRLGDKTKFERWIRPGFKRSNYDRTYLETLAQTRARNAREYKWYFGRVLTYPGFGKGHTYLGFYKVFL